MKNASLKPILNTSLPPQFRKIRLELAREPAHPEGDAGTGYDIVAPLDDDFRIDAKLWWDHREACRVARRRTDEEYALGHLLHCQGGGWVLHYDASPAKPDEVGFHFKDERFVPGEYVSIGDGKNMHTYRVTMVLRL
jgi:hypothetical protein